MISVFCHIFEHPSVNRWVAASCSGIGACFTGLKVYSVGVPILICGVGAWIAASLDSLRFRWPARPLERPLLQNDGSVELADLGSQAV